MKNTLLNLIFILISSHITAQPELNSWLLNISGETGYNNQPSNVQSIHYTNDNVFVSCSCIPGYDIGPWAGNPNQRKIKIFVLKLLEALKKLIIIKLQEWAILVFGLMASQSLMLKMHFHTIIKVYGIKMLSFLKRARLMSV